MDSQNRTASDADFLAKELAKVPPGYSPVAHLSASISIGIAALVLGFVVIESFGWPQIAAALGTIVIANLVEWWAHRELLHRRRRFWEVLYDQHTPWHHRIYRRDSMSVGSRREWYFVLMPARGVLGIAVSGIPMALGAWWLFGADIGWTVLVTVALYAVAYEVTHLSYHLPVEHRIQRAWIIRKLSRHHARHHHPPYMQKYNFNVTLPLWDWILGTRAPKE